MDDLLPRSCVPVTTRLARRLSLRAGPVARRGPGPLGVTWALAAGLACGATPAREPPSGAPEVTTTGAETPVAPTEPTFVLEGDELRIVRTASEPVELAEPKAGGAPPLAVDAPLEGMLQGTPFRFRIESAASPDGLCPPAPTTIVVLEGDRELGRTIVDAPIVREIGQGVLGLVMVPEGEFLLIAYGEAKRRVITLDGRIVFEGDAATRNDDCDCCE